MTASIDPTSEPESTSPIGEVSLSDVVYTLDETAILLKVTVETIKGLRRDRKLCAVRIGRHDRFLLEDIKEFLSNQKDDRQ